MKALFGFIFRVVRFGVFSILFVILLGIGMAAGGFFLLDYLIKGEMVEVPMLYGKSKAQAIETLNEHDLLPNLPVEEIPREGVAPGIVIEQRPLPGQEVKKGRTVTLTVSARVGETLIPNLMGQRQHEIAAELSSSRLNPIFSEMHHPEIPEGVIIAQNPLPGRRYVNKDEIHILVSIGPPTAAFVMPNYVGKYIENVVPELEHKPFAFTRGNIHYQTVKDPTKHNVVLAQNPKPGTKIHEQDPIRLTVGALEQEIPRKRVEMVSFHKPLMTTNRQLAILIWDELAKKEAAPHTIPLNYDQYGETIELPVEVQGDALVMLALVEDVENIRFEGGQIPTSIKVLESMRF